MHLLCDDEVAKVAAYIHLVGSGNVHIWLVVGHFEFSYAPTWKFHNRLTDSIEECSLLLLFAEKAIVLVQLGGLPVSV